MRSEKEFKFLSPLYLDSTGDGTVAFLSGAEYAYGRESKKKYGETLAPEERDDYTLGNTIFFYAKDKGKPVTFYPPEFAYCPEELEFLEDRFRGIHIDETADGCDYWWFEYGGVLDTIKEDEEITRELQKVVWGIWDYIKNSGKFNADNLTIEWMGNLSGKRESRRFIGDYILKQQDLQKQHSFPDAVCHGGWPIDTHPPGGIYSGKPPCNQIPVGIYDIPFRTLYTKDIKNLFIAGRIHSASHMAFSSTRVMATCAVMGQSVGTAAKLSQKYDCYPEEIYQQYMDELQQLLLKEDNYIIGLENHDKSDKARKAVINSSCTKNFENRKVNNMRKLCQDLCLVLPLNKKIKFLNLFLEAITDTELILEIYTGERPENYFLENFVGKKKIEVKAGSPDWEKIDLSTLAIPGAGNKIFVILKANEKINVGTSDQKLTGVLSFLKNNGEGKRDCQICSRRCLDPVFEEREYTPGTLDTTLEALTDNICFHVEPSLNIYSANNVNDGFSRPYGLPHCWVSSEINDKPKWLQLYWEQRVKISEIRLFFNTDLDRRFVNLRESEDNTILQTIKDYDIQVKIENTYKTIFKKRDNYQRLCVHKIKPVFTDSMRFIFYQTNGSPYAEVFQVRVY